MNSLNVIFSAFLSLLVAIPLCCCSAKAEHVKEGSSCCQTEKESSGSDHGPEICACDSHDAKDKPEAVRLPGKCVIDIVQPDSEPSMDPILRGVPNISSSRPWIIDDPLRDVFAKYSRWII